MPPPSSKPALPLPRGWRKITRAGVLYAISAAAMAMDLGVEQGRGEPVFTSAPFG